MRLLRLCKIRRYRPSPPPPLHQFVCHYSSSSSHSLLISSTHHYHHHHHHGRLNNNPGCSSELLRHLSLDCTYLSRRFSSEPGVLEPDEPLLPVEAAELDEPLLPIEAPEPDEPFIAVQAVISLLDYYHDVTGFPWWVIISSSTVAMRLAIFPLVVLQLKKLRRIGELLPQLPPPFPPPLSGRSFKDQIALFWKEKESAGCPSVFWFFSSVAVQVPCFFLWLMSVRTMSLDHHPGFDAGGILWLQNLTEYPHGVLGPIFPLCIAGLHLANVQLSVRKSSLQHVPGTLKILVKIYKVYLQLLTLPILIATFNVPQGSLIYWLTNSTFSLIQLLCLQHPKVLDCLGLLEMNGSAIPVKTIGSSGVADIVITKEGEISAQTLSPDDLVSYTLEVLGGGHKDAAIALLRVALVKDPDHLRALLIMGQTLLHTKRYAEAAKCLEKTISKLLTTGNPTKVEEVELLILSSQWAGIANVLQEKMEEGLLHLERIAQMKEPQDSKTKAHYYDGLVILAIALAKVDRRAEALNFLHKAADYDPAYNQYIQQLEDDAKEFASDLSNCKRY